MFTLSSDLGKPYKESDLKLGEKFYTDKKFMRTFLTLNNIVWIETTITATEVMFIGYTNVYDGEVYQASYDQDTGYTDPPCFIQTKTHRVLVVQPILGNRYRKPFYILSEQQKRGYWKTADDSAKQKEMELKQQKRLD